MYGRHDKDTPISRISDDKHINIISRPITLSTFIYPFANTHIHTAAEEEEVGQEKEGQEEPDRP
jgi:hypothetical protein